MFNETTTAALEAELLRQDAAFAELTETLKSLGDVELHVPATFLEELDAIVQRCTPITAETFNGLRA